MSKAHKTSSRVRKKRQTPFFDIAFVGPCFNCPLQDVCWISSVGWDRMNQLGYCSGLRSGGIWCGRTAEKLIKQGRIGPGAKKKKGNSPQ